MLSPTSPGHAMGEGTSGELVLALAVVRRLIKDTQSRRPTIQEEARAFLAGEGLRFWADLLGTDCAQLTQAVHRHLQESFIQR